MPDLHVDFRALERLMSTIENSMDKAGTALADVDDQVRQVAEVWEGAAASGFQRTITDWKTAHADLGARLASLHNLVATAYSNHAGAVRTNTGMWRV